MTTQRKAPRKKSKFERITRAAKPRIGKGVVERQAKYPSPIITVLEEANALVNGPRQADYGDPRENFTRWRDMARATGRPGLATITGEDLAILMICLKVCRDTHGPKRDNAVDGAGYFELLDRVRGI